MTADSTFFDQQMAFFREHQAMVSDRLALGADPADIVEQLVGFGMERDSALSMVDKLSDDGTTGSKTVASGASARRSSASSDGGSMTMGIAGAFVAAVIGGLVWGLIVKMSGYELGLIAWGIGAAVGYGAVMMSGGVVEASTRVAAVGASIFGILLGKYLSFLVVWNELIGTSLAELAEGAGAELGLATIGFMSGFPMFMENFSAMFDLFDALWFFLAVSTAWKITGDAAD